MLNNNDTKNTHDYFVVRRYSWKMYQKMLKKMAMLLYLSRDGVMFEFLFSVLTQFYGYLFKN